MNRFFKKVLDSLENEIRFVNILEKQVLKGKILVQLNKDCVRRPGKPKENYIQIKIIEIPNRLVQFIMRNKIFVVDSIYVYEHPQDHKNIYINLHHILSVEPKEELNEQTAIKTFKLWVEKIFNVDIDVIIIDTK